MNGLLLMYSITVLATVYAIPPGLSESFYLQATGTLTRNISGTVTTTDYSRFNTAVDTARLLAFQDIAGTAGGSVFILISGNDNLTYLGLNDTCGTIPGTGSGNISDVIISIFGDFTTGVEAPSGTITYTSLNGIDILVTVNGLPTSLTTTTSFSTTNLDIHSYTNSAPPFSIFALPNACSNFTCNYCCNTATGVASSFLLMLAALAMFLLPTV